MELLFRGHLFIKCYMLLNWNMHIIATCFWVAMTILSCIRTIIINAFYKCLSVLISSAEILKAMFLLIRIRTKIRAVHETKTSEN